MFGRRMIRFLIATISLLTVLCVCVVADVPYRSFNRTEWQTSVPSPESFKPDKVVIGEIEGIGSLTNPADFCISDDGLIYTVEENGGIWVFDSDLNFVKKIESLKYKGEDQSLNDPTGIYVDSKGFIYVADSGNQRGVKIDKDGNIIAEYKRPESSVYTSTVYIPKKILCDSSGLVYILSQDVYQGMIVFSPDGEFKHFFGSAKIQMTIAMIADKFWKSILSRQQVKNSGKFVPIEFTNMDIDDKDFIYTCSSYTNNDVEQLRKLNYYGKNVYPYTENFGEKDVVYYKRKSLKTNFVDIHISKDDFIYALDSEKGRIYCYDQEGNMLYTFGTSGEMFGGFLNPVAVDSFEQFVYVLDNKKGSIIRFAPTKYGALIKEAVTLYLDGKYREALEPWNEILTMNSNFQLAYNGIGQALMMIKDYKGAVENFRRGYDRQKESAAFEKYRTEIMRANIVPLFILFIVLVVLIYIVTNRKLRKKVFGLFKKEDKPVKNRLPLYFKGVLASPVVTYNEMKFVRYQNVRFTGIMLLSLFLVEVFKRQFYGFRFNMNNPDTLNIFIQLMSTIIPFVLFCMSNWAICSIVGGEGKFLEISTNLSFALIPYIFTQAIGILLSNILVLNESTLLNWFLTFGILWSAMLVFQSIRIVHQYSSVKTIFVIILSIFGIIVIVFLALLLVALFRQIYSFGYSIYSELMYRR